MLRNRVLLVATLLGMALVPSPAQAQWGEPFASLSFGVNPHCPFDCDSITLIMSGELTSTSWKPPELLIWNRVGDSIDVQIRVEYDPNPALPVLNLVAKIFHPRSPLYSCISIIHHRVT